LRARTVASAVPSIAEPDVARMRSELLFDGAERGRKLSRFWSLLALAAVIATAGVVGDSTATVIGAMIVAPLMTPILGVVYSVVSGDVRNLVRCAVLVTAGAVAVVFIGWAIGKFVPFPVDAASNSQVASRIHPRLIDLVAALATGAVGAFALVRSDISDTLPGVAIAISLVPPLSVVGLTLEAGKPHQSTGALLLFVMNVAAILLSGMVVMAIYRVGAVARLADASRRLSSRVATAVFAAAVVLLAIPLAATSEQVTNDQLHTQDVEQAAGPWSRETGWQVVSVSATSQGIVVHATGPLPIPNPETFRAALDAKGLRKTSVKLQLTPLEIANLPGR